MTNLCRKISAHFGRMASIHGKLFLFIISISTTAFIGYLFCAKATLRDSQKEIKDSYAEHILKADSLYIDLTNYNKAMTDNILSLNSGLFTDSLIKSTLARNNNLSQKQYDALLSLIEEHSKAIKQCQEQYESKIQRDSLRLGVERELLNGQTKTMVDLHLNKIEHEYSNINMWAAIMTIVFLVFSFYSISKIDELIQQGNEGVRNIRRLERDGEQEAEKLRDTTKNLIEDTETNVDTFIQEQQKRINATFLAVMKRTDDIEKLSNDSLNNFDKQRKTLDDEFQRISKEYEDRIKQLLDAKIEQFQDINNRMNNLITQTSTYINKLKSNEGVVSNNTEPDNDTNSDNDTGSKNNTESDGKEGKK